MSSLATAVGGQKKYRKLVRLEACPPMLQARQTLDMEADRMTDLLLEKFPELRTTYDRGTVRNEVLEILKEMREEKYR